jgi:uncharacterized protein YegL
MKNMKKWGFVLLSCLVNQTFATGLEPVTGEQAVYINTVNFALEVRERYVSGLMEIQLSAKQGEDHAAALRFPLPPDAVLHKAELFIPQDEKWIVAETIGRREGSEVYHELVAQQLDPLLIQRIGTDFYRAKIYPIAAHTGLHLKIHYAHLLEMIDGENYRLQIPFAHPDSTPSPATKGLNITVLTDPDYWQNSSWKIADEFATPTTINLIQGQAALNLPEFEMAQDITVDLQPHIPLPTSSAIVYQPSSSDLPTQMHAYWQPELPSELETVVPRQVIFVLDISGSMSGQKIVQARKAVINSLQALSDNDDFGIVAFESEVYVFRQTMTRGHHLEGAIEWVENRQAGGSTAMMAGLKAAAEIGVTSSRPQHPIDLFLMTDGLPNVGSSTAEQILADIQAEMRRLEREIRIFAVGIGSNLDQSLLNHLTQATQGEATFALDDNEITGQVAALFDRVRAGGMTDVKVSVNHDSAEQSFDWRRLFANQMIQVATQGHMNQMQLTFAATSPDNEQIVLNQSPLFLNVSEEFSRLAAPLAAKVWADQLERRIDEQGETASLVDEAVALAKTYGILTRYSSFIALRDENLYVKQDIARIERDPAGIALQPIIVTPTNEQQIGGEGIQEDDEAEMGDASPFFAPITAAAAPRNFYPNPQSLSSSWVDKSNSYSAGAAAGALPTSAMDMSEEAWQPAADIYCAYPVLNDTGQLYIPSLSYQNQDFWATLRLEIQPDGSLILVVLDYDEVTYTTRSQACQQVSLSSAMELNIPLLIYDTPDQDIKVVELRLMSELIEQQLQFKVLSYTEVK